jgi:glycosyltransferase involved in cell wall biosynthesis
MTGGTRSYEFARRLVERGHQVDVVTGDPQPATTGRRRITTEAGITVHWLPVAYGNEMNYRQRLAAFARFAWRAAAVSAAVPCDVVLASSTPLTVAIPGAFAALRRRAPMVLEVRDLWPEVPIAFGALRSPVTRWAAWRLEAWAYRRSAHVIALCPGMASSIRRRFPGVPVTVVPNGSDLDLFADADRTGRALREATPWLADRPLVLFAGTIGKYNGLDYLVRMAAVLATTDPEVRIAILGAGGAADEVRRLAGEAGVLDRNLFMLGPVPKSAVAAYFGACDLAVSLTIDLPQLGPNAGGSSANKVFDALAAGRPVAINYGGSLADILTDSGAGLVLPADDPRAAAAAVSGLLGDRAAGVAARAAARALAHNRFSRDLLFEDFERVLSAAARTPVAATDRATSGSRR